MKLVYLCGHTGSNNRGCEAIVRSTVKILQKAGVEQCRLFSYNVPYDKRNHLDEIVPISGYRYDPRLMRGFYRYVLKDVLKAHKNAYKRIYRKAKPDITLCIGGDTYCYEKPYGNYALNTVSASQRVPTVLWGCSVDQRILQNPTMLQDIQKYRHIVARESLTYEILKACVTPEQTLWLACDPAFHLDVKETQLPEVFSSGDTIGINISSFFVNSNNVKGCKVYQNVKTLIRYILEETNFNVCIIPHVYVYEKANEDLIASYKLMEEYANEPRIGFLDKDLSCTEIKYVISRCRFFIGARTHSVIAAYSTGVPTLALSYSIKSLGIAKDIFGTYDGYVLPKNEMVADDCLKDAFVNNIMNREEEIRSVYERVMPDYKQSLINVANEIFADGSQQKE